MKPEIISYRDHPKGWGNEKWIVNKEKYCLKILSFKKDSFFIFDYLLALFYNCRIQSVEY